MTFEKLNRNLANQVKALVAAKLKGPARLINYDNGREHGYVLTDRKSGASVTFAENRNTDDVVVYSGAMLLDYAEEYQERIYDARRLFSTPLEAANFIVRYIRDARKVQQ